MTSTKIKTDGKQYELKFTLIYFGLFLLELSILFGNSSRNKDVPFSTWLVMTSAHLGGVLVAIQAIQLFTRLSQRTLFTFRQLIPIGLLISGSASLSYNVLGHYLQAPLGSPASVLLTVIIFGTLWFPQAIVLESLKNTIFESIRTYEKRLIIQSRTHIRESSDYRLIENRITDSIIEELRLKCAALVKKIQIIQGSDRALEEKNSELTKLLVGKVLREFSIQLEQRGNLVDHQSYANRALRSIQLFARQYRLLYWQAALFNQLSKKTYAFILLLIVAPSMLHYLTFKQIIFTTIVLLISSLLLANIIEIVIKANKKSSLFISSVLTYLIGSLPGLLQPLESYLFPQDKGEYPLFILGFMVPAGYYVLIKTLQLIQPSTQKLIETDKLIVSSGVKNAVSGVIEYEFLQTLSHSWAIFVHGKILTRLAATSLRLEQAKNNKDADAFNQAIESLTAILNNPEESYNNEQRTLTDELNVRLLPWDGLVEISIDLQPGVTDLTGSRVTDLGEVLEEAISNSVRHGKSGKITISLNLLNHNELEILIRDNSEVPILHEQINYGLGTKLFNLACDGRWNLVHDNSGTTFAATMNMKEPSA